VRACQGGQSLVEAALALPVVLLLAIALVDVGRMFAVSAVLANATREGAALASRDLTATPGSVAQRVCDETGWTSFGDPCPTDLVVSYTSDPAGDIARVDSTYTLRLLTGRVASLFGRPTVTLRASAILPLVRTSGP
jgi:Flp pilus assembly protein TadG